MNEKQKLKYYELICGGEVIGATDSEGLLNCAQEDDLDEVGLISQKHFEEFGDNESCVPVSKKRFTIEIVQVVHFEPIKRKKKKTL